MLLRGMGFHIKFFKAFVHLGGGLKVYSLML